MAWIESHQELLAHPKTRKAAALLGVGRAQMVGHLHCLWWWVLDYADDGDLTKWDVTDIALAAEWEGDPDKFVSALIDCGSVDAPGFLERDGECIDGVEFVDDELEVQLRTAALVVHDWPEHGGKLVVKRLRDAAWKRRKRSGGKSSTRRDDVPTTDERQDDDGASRAPANTTQHDTTPPEQKSSAEARKRATRLPSDWRPDQEPELVRQIGGQQAAKREFDKFVDYWQAKSGKDATKRDWQATWRNWLRRAAEQLPADQRKPVSDRPSYADLCRLCDLPKDSPSHDDLCEQLAVR